MDAIEVQMVRFLYGRPFRLLAHIRMLALLTRTSSGGWRMPPLLTAAVVRAGPSLYIGDPIPPYKSTPLLAYTRARARELHALLQFSIIPILPLHPVHTLQTAHAQTAPSPRSLHHHGSGAGLVPHQVKRSDSPIVSTALTAALTATSSAGRRSWKT